MSIKSQEAEEYEQSAEFLKEKWIAADLVLHNAKTSLQIAESSPSTSIIVRGFCHAAIAQIDGLIL